MAALLRSMSVPEDEIAARIEAQHPEPEPLVIWPENIVALMIFQQASGYWSYVSTGMGAVRMSLDWWRLIHVTLAKVPKVFARPELKRKKDRLRYIVESVQIIEQAAVGELFEQEKKRQSDMKREREREKAKGIVRTR